MTLQNGFSKLGFTSQGARNFVLATCGVLISAVIALWLALNEAKSDNQRLSQANVDCEKYYAKKIEEIETAQITLILHLQDAENQQNKNEAQIKRIEKKL